MMYVKELETKKKEIPAHKPLTTNHGTLITIVIVVGISALIGVGFAYASIHLGSLFGGICALQGEHIITS